MQSILTYGMVGGGPDSLIGDTHRKAIALDNSAKLLTLVRTRHTRAAAQRNPTSHPKLLRKYLYGS